MLMHTCICIYAQMLSHVCLRPHRLVYQAPLSMGFSRQEYWSGLSFPSLINTHMYILYNYQKDYINKFFIHSVEYYAITKK